MAGIWTERANHLWSITERLQDSVRAKKSTIEDGLENELCAAIRNLCQELRANDPDGGQIVPASSLMSEY